MLTTQGGAHYRILQLDGSGLFSPARHWRLLGPQTDTTLIFYLVFAARAADTVAAAPLTTAALYLAGGEKAEKVPEPSTVLVELLTLIGKERQRKRK